MKVIVTICILATAGFGMMSLLPAGNPTDSGLSAEMPVTELLISLGEVPQKHYVKDIDPKKVQMGEEIVLKGNTTMADGTRSKKVSEFFVCTDCHNLGPEAPNALENDPDIQLRSAMDKDIPYLPRSTFLGMVNRTG